MTAAPRAAGRLHDQTGATRVGPVIAIVAVIIALVVAGTLVVQRRSRPTALLIGDSITVVATPQLEGELDGGYRVTIDGRSGFRVDEMVAPAQQHAATGPSARAVMNLGTNDVNQDWPLDDSVRNLELIATTFGPACVRVVTVNEFMLTPEHPSRARAVAYNVELRAFASAHGYGIIDWSAMVGANIAAADPTPLTFDTIHPSEAGSKALAGAYRDALATCPPDI